MTQAYFIAATGTGTGKTWFTAQLARQLAAQGKTVRAVKPVISGFDPGAAENDTHRLLDAMGHAVSDAAIDAISPWRFCDPLSPDIASRRENRPIDFATLVDWCERQSRKTDDYLLIESIGGVMTPLTEHHTVLDWMAALHYPAVMLAGAYLGTLSHTLSAIEALRGRNVALRALVVNAYPQNGDIGELVESLRNFVGESVPIHGMPEGESNLLPIIA